MTNVSIVTYNTPQKDLTALMQSLSLCPSVRTIYIIDHSESNNIYEYVKNDFRVKYIHEENRGYGGGHNVALRKSIDDGAKYHVVLNPDLKWDDDVIGSLQKYMDCHPDCGQVMPKIIYNDGTVQHLCKLLPTPVDLILRRFVPIKAWQARNAARYELHESGYNQELEVPSLSGCFMFLRCEVLKKVGLFDERYFMYAEDLDLCRRIGSESKTMYYPKIEVTHGYAKESYHNSRLLKYHIQSIIKYFNKWGWVIDKERGRRNKKVLNMLKSMRCE